jgi:hypothetical protein
MVARFLGRAAGFLVANRRKRRNGKIGPAFQRSAAEIVALGQAIAATPLHEAHFRLAQMVFGDRPTPEQLRQAEAVVAMYLHDRCLIERVTLLDAEGEPYIASFRATLIRSLAVSAVGILLDGAEAPVAPVEPYPGPVQLLDDVWMRVAGKR